VVEARCGASAEVFRGGATSAAPLTARSSLFGGATAAPLTGRASLFAGASPAAPSTGGLFANTIPPRT